MGLQGNHNGPIVVLPIFDHGSTLNNCSRKLMTKGNFGKDGFIAFVIKPSVKIRSTNPTVSDPEKHLVIHWSRSRKIDNTGCPFLSGESAIGFHLGEGRSACMEERISLIFSGPKRRLTSESPNSTEVPAPRDVINRPS
jgi:hypothetical protein